MFSGLLQLELPASGWCGPQTLALLATAASALVSSHAASTRELLRVTWSLVPLAPEAGECIGKHALARLWCIGVSAVVGSVLLNSVACGAPNRTLLRGVGA